MNIHRNNSMEIDYDKHLNDEITENGDVVQVVIDAFTEAFLDPESDHYWMTHYINEYPISFDRFNEFLGVLFETELLPSASRLGFMLFEPYVTLVIMNSLRSFPEDEMA
jgi:hypothetical protein